MKAFAIVLIGCLPLGWLTALNLVRWNTPVESAASADERPKLDLPALQERATKADRTAVDDLPFARSLISLEPFTDSLQIIDATTVADRFKPVAKAWQDYTKSHAAVVGATNLYRTKVKPSPADEVKQLTRFLETRPVAGLRTGDLVERWCQDRIDILNQSESTAKSLKAIRQHFAAKQYGEVVAKVELLPTIGLTDDEKGDLARLVGKSHFALHWQTGPETGITTPLKARARIVRLTDLLKKSPLPVDEEDQAVITRYEQEKAALVRKLRVDDLFESPPKLLLDLVEKSASILNDDQEARPRLHAGLKKWIEVRLRTKLAPEYPPNLKEAWHVNGNYRRGVFVRSTVKDPPKFLYWSDPTRTGKTHDLEIFQKQLAEGPDEMLEIRLCRRYNERLAALLKEMNSEAAWEGFAKLCEEMQKQLTDYYAKVPPKPGETVSFQVEANLARELLSQWSDVRRILE